MPSFTCSCKEISFYNIKMMEMEPNDLKPYRKKSNTIQSSEPNDSKPYRKKSSTIQSSKCRPSGIFLEPFHPKL